MNHEYSNLIEKMAKFLEEEPSGRFQAIDHATESVFWHYAFRGIELEHISEFTNQYDPSQELTLIYLANGCRFIIEHTTCPVIDALHCTPQIEKYSECLGLVNSSALIGCRRSILTRLAAAVNAMSPTKLIGNYEKALGKAVDDGLNALFESFPKLHFEVYMNSGKPVGSLQTTSLSVQSCQSLAECLLRLEKSPDGIYVCYISNPGTLDGWFGFFVKSNGNIFSYNERIDEKYIGQHGNMRNGRYAENKAYDLFPYELCKASEETDYKGYSKEINIGEKLSLVGDGFDLIIRMLLSFVVIAQKHSGETIQGEPVLVNSLLPHNMALLAEMATAANSTAVVEWKNSPIVAYTAKSAMPTFDVSKVLNGEYNREFDKQSGCFFGEKRQDIVDAYGNGFTIEQDKILASNSSLRLIGNGESEQEFIGTKERLRTQAYYEVRKQLRYYIWQKMNAEYKAFGCDEQLGKWYREHLIARKETILRYCLEAYNSKKTDDEGHTYGSVYLYSNKDEPGLDNRFGNGYHAAEVSISNKTGMGFYGSFMLSQSKGWKRKCWITGCEPSYYFRFEFYTYQQVEEFIGCRLPKFCIGWERDHFPSGNTILSIVDPIDQMVHPLMQRGSQFSFDVAVALSKSAINKIKKEQ